jgi:hypothetical protein
MKMTNVVGNVSATGDIKRFMIMGRVLPADSLNDSKLSANSPPEPFDGRQLMICYPEKMVQQAVSVFQTRFQMHQRVYTHKAVKQIEFMITDALFLADPYIRISGTSTDAHPDGLYRLSECVDDMDAFSKLNDSILDVISLTQAGSGPEFDDLRKAKQIIQRIRTRQLYICIGQTSFVSEDRIAKMSEEEILSEILSASRNDFDFGTVSEHPDWPFPESPVYNEVSNPPITSSENCISSDDIIVEKMHIHYGLKNKNPVDRLRFFPKRIERSAETKEVIVGRRVPESKYESLLPRRFEDRAVRVFCRHPEKEVAVRELFELWCNRVDANSPFPSSSQPS